MVFQVFAAVTAPKIGEAADFAAQDFSILGLIFDAHIVVQLVMIILILASLLSWAVILDKWFSLGRIRKSAARFEDDYWSGRADDMVNRPGTEKSNATLRVLTAASREWNEARRVKDPAEISRLVDRADRAMRAAVDREVSRASKGTGFLSIVSSASPFIGLFGTVWGIMYAFINIAASQDTSLGVVAGPIAEALFATGLGLVAAIPASIFFNKFTGDLNSLADQLDAFSQDVVVRMARRASDTAED